MTSNSPIYFIQFERREKKTVQSLCYLSIYLESLCYYLFGKFESRICRGIRRHMKCIDTGINESNHHYRSCMATIDMVGETGIQHEYQVLRSNQTEFLVVCDGPVFEFSKSIYCTNLTNTNSFQIVQH